MWKVNGNNNGRKRNPLQGLEVRVKIKLKKLKMYEVQSSYIVFYLPIVGCEKVSASDNASQAKPASFKCKRAVNWYFLFELNLQLPHDLTGNSL